MLGVGRFTYYTCCQDLWCHFQYGSFFEIEIGFMARKELLHICVQSYIYMLFVYIVLSDLTIADKLQHT